jgi:hypothetical protein
MENPAEYVVIGAKMVWVFIGGSSLLTLIGVWLLARFTSTFDAYAGERAKIQAQYQNVEKLVANTEKLTAATETIKAKVIDETWDRQQRWTLQQTVYRDLLVALDALDHAVSLESFAVSQSSEPASPSERDLIERARAKAHECDEAFQRVAAGSVICVSKEAFAIVQRVRNRFGPSGSTTIAETHLLNKALGELSRIARLDLKYSDFTESSSSDENNAAPR